MMVEKVWIALDEDDREALLATFLGDTEMARTINMLEWIGDWVDDNAALLIAARKQIMGEDDEN